MAEEQKSTSELKAKLQQHLDDAKQRIAQVRQDLAELHDRDKESIRKKSSEVKARIQAQQARMAQMRDEVVSWMREKQDQTDEKVTSWRQKRELKRLARRADRAEDYAVNILMMTMWDADEAEAAVLDALDARIDADAAAGAA